MNPTSQLRVALPLLWDIAVLTPELELLQLLKPLLPQNPWPAASRTKTPLESDAIQHINPLSCKNRFHPLLEPPVFSTLRFYPPPKLRVFFPVLPRRLSTPGVPSTQREIIATRCQLIRAATRSAFPTLRAAAPTTASLLRRCLLRLRYRRPHPPSSSILPRAVLARCLLRLNRIQRCHVLGL